MKNYGFQLWTFIIALSKRTEPFWRNLKVTNFIARLNKLNQSFLNKRLYLLNFAVRSYIKPKIKMGIKCNFIQWNSNSRQQCIFLRKAVMQCPLEINFICKKIHWPRQVNKFQEFFKKITIDKVKVKTFVFPLSIECNNRQRKNSWSAQQY